MTKEEFIEKIKEIKGSVDDVDFFLEYNKVVYNILEENGKLHKEISGLYYTLNEIREFIYENRLKHKRYVNDEINNLRINDNAILQIIEQAYIRAREVV